MRTDAFLSNCSFGCLILHLSIVSLVTLALANSGFAKMYQEPKSFIVQVRPLEQVNRKVLPKVDVERLLAEDRTRLGRLERPQPLRFALPLDAFYTLGNSGTTTKMEGGSLWQLRIRSEDAKSHSLGITKFNMPDGAKLWIYDPARKHVEGPYTGQHRSHRGSLWTPIIEGDEIVIEVFMPDNIQKPAIEIRKVNQGYRRFNKAGILGDTAGDCNIDVMCPAGISWSKPMRAVGAYTIDGKDICTGTMINNTGEDRTPYFLSANHCGVNPGNDDTVVVYWNYQKLNPTKCNSNQFSHGPGSTSDNQTGSRWLAANGDSDFALLKLSSPPDPSYKVFYAGWDTAASPQIPVVGIHHPWLEVKAISTSSNRPVTAAYLSSTPTATDNRYWRVDWNSGVTEKGSSGSCLFAANGRCVGQLRGGNPLGCQSLNTQNNRDWYGKLSASWTMLQSYLDPRNMIKNDVTGIDGVEPLPYVSPPSAPTNIRVQ